MPEVADPSHYRLVVQQMLAGRVVPFLGAGANLADRLDDDRYEPGKNLPSSKELTEKLAAEWGYPEEEPDLLRVSQWGEFQMGPGGLYDRLHEVFAAEYEPSGLHEFLADHAARQLQRDPSKAKHQLIVTTNYDDALERAFVAKEVPFDVVWYEAKQDDHHGSFFHRTPDGRERLIEAPGEDMEVSRDRNPVILKIHGAVNEDPDKDSYVITESNYLDYLSRTGLEKFPASLKLVMSNAYFLFLGYSLQDWNLRALLHRIWEDQGALQHASWAIQWSEKPSRLDELFWNTRNVRIYNIKLSEYIAGLRTALDGELGGEAAA